MVRGRVGDPRLLPRIAPLPYDVILSDMSPRVSGAYATDHARSVGLVRDAMELARVALRTGGVFVAKVFAGDMLDELVAELRPQFERVVLTKPPASRESSSEMYVIGIEYRPRIAEPPPG